jgi:hypothetical protein
MRLATEDDLHRIFGSENLLIGALVRPRPSAVSSQTIPTEQESADGDRPAIDESLADKD